MAFLYCAGVTTLNLSWPAVSLLMDITEGHIVTDITEGYIEATYVYIAMHVATVATLLNYNQAYLNNY